MWWLETLELNAEASEEQAARYEGDPWDGPIAAWLEGRENVTVEQVLTLCIQKPQKDCTQADQNRVARSLRALKWERFRKREDGVLRWKYRRPQ